VSARHAREGAVSAICRQQRLASWLGAGLLLASVVLLLLGASGGPKNVGMVPGLYMYSKAFVDTQFGYACALGMSMFVLILLITIIYNKYVKVDK